MRLVLQKQKNKTIKQMSLLRNKTRVYNLNVLLSEWYCMYHIFSIKCQAYLFKIRADRPPQCLFEPEFYSAPGIYLRKYGACSELISCFRLVTGATLLCISSQKSRQLKRLIHCTYTYVLFCYYFREMSLCYPNYF